MLIHMFVMLKCIFDVFEWWFELVECICASLSALKGIRVEENII